jgi:hypothetical protein
MNCLRDHTSMTIVELLHVMALWPHTCCINHISVCQSSYGITITNIINVFYSSSLRATTGYNKFTKAVWTVAEQKYPKS